MLASLLVKGFCVVVFLGIVGLIPVIILNRRTSRTDRSIYKKGFSASSDLKPFRTSLQDKEPNSDKKLKSFKA